MLVNSLLFCKDQKCGYKICDTVNLLKSQERLSLKMKYRDSELMIKYFVTKFSFPLLQVSNNGQYFTLQFCILACKVFANLVSTF